MIEIVTSFHPERGDNQPQHSCEVFHDERWLGRLHGTTPQLLNRSVLRLLYMNGLQGLPVTHRHEGGEEESVKETRVRDSVG
jgi:hypothetical protein